MCGPLKLTMQERESIPDGTTVQDAGYSLQELVLKGVAISSFKPMGGGGVRKDKHTNKLGTQWKKKLGALLPNKITAPIEIYCDFLNISRH